MPGITDIRRERVVGPFAVAVAEDTAEEGGGRAGVTAGCVITVVVCTCFWALPNSTELTCAAKRNEHNVSGDDANVGETFTNINALPSPDKQSCNNMVNFELRYGTCDALF